MRALLDNDPASAVAGSNAVSSPAWMSGWSVWARRMISPASCFSRTWDSRMRARKPSVSRSSFRLRLSSANQGSSAWSSITAGLRFWLTSDHWRRNSCTATLSCWHSASSLRKAASDERSVRRWWKKNWASTPQ
ncbi:hypothetical protein FQZ97_869020 [compost metagenome]